MSDWKQAELVSSLQEHITKIEAIKFWSSLVSGEAQASSQNEAQSLIDSGSLDKRRRRRPPPPPPKRKRPPSWRPRSPPPQSNPNPNPSPSEKGKYADVLGLSWKFYLAQRAGKIPNNYPLDWIYSSLLDDAVVGGWYDAGDILKLNFPLGEAVSVLAWGLLEFKDVYVSNGLLESSLVTLRVAVDYLAACYKAPFTYVGQIGSPQSDHSYWGRVSQYNLPTPRSSYVWNKNSPASDLLGSVSAALSSASLVFKDNDPAYAADLRQKAVELYEWGTSKLGRYHFLYIEATNPYPSSHYQDHLVWAAAWLYRTTGEATYLTQAHNYWTQYKSSAGMAPDPYCSWDSVFGHAAVMLLTLADSGIQVPGIDTYRTWVRDYLHRGWLQPDGFWNIVKTPKGMVYPSWSGWNNLQYPTKVASILLIHAKTNPDASTKAAEVAFAKSQIDYAIGSTGRSFVVGYGSVYPQQPHHAQASCPDMPAACGWDQFNADAPNPQIIYGAMVGGPEGEIKNKNDPDNSYTDKRSDYSSNEPSVGTNSGLVTAAAGLCQLL